jgi:hypothetical protein
VGGKIIIHSNREIPSISSAGFTLRPGKVYSIYIKKTTTINKDAIDCKDYLAEYRENAIQENYSSNLQFPMSREVPNLLLLFI